MRNYRNIWFVWLFWGAVNLVPLPGNSQETSPERMAVYDQYMKIESLLSGNVSEAKWIDETDALQFSIKSSSGNQTLIYDAGKNALVSQDSFVEKNESDQPRLVQDRYPETSKPLYEVPAPDGTKFLTASDYNLAYRSAGGEDLNFITHDGVAENYWTIEDAVWSSDGKYVAAIKVDVREVHKTPVVHWLGREERISWHSYAQSGGPVPMTKLSIFNILQKSVVNVPLGEHANYINIHGFRSHSSELYFSSLSVDGKILKLMAADIATGKTRLVLQEPVSTYVSSTEFDEGYGAFFVPFSKSGDFLWVSERQGWRHIYRFSDKGRLIRKITTGEYPVVKIIRFDERNNWVYFTAHVDNNHLYDAHLMRASLSNGKVERLTKDRGNHTILFSPTGKYFLDMHSTVSRPPQSDLRRADGRLVKTISKASIDALIDIGWTEPEEFTVLASDGKTELSGVMYKPYDFDPERSYPVIQYVYGGSHISMVPRNFIPQTHGTYLKFANALAQLGYVIVAMDPRGTPGRSKAFHDVVYKNLGQFETDDFAAGLRQLARTRSYMNVQEVGVFGLSFGGYFTIRAMLQHPDLYGIGVAGGPAIEMRDVYSVLGDRLIGSPAEYSKQYDLADNRLLVNQLEGKLLIVQGTSDVNVPFSQPMKFIDALVRADKPYDLVVLPEQNHLFQFSDRPDKYFRHPYWWSSIRRYFLEHLPPIPAVQQ